LSLRGFDGIYPEKTKNRNRHFPCCSILSHQLVGVFEKFFDEVEELCGLGATDSFVIDRQRQVHNLSHIQGLGVSQLPVPAVHTAGHL